MKQFLFKNAAILLLLILPLTHTYGQADAERKALIRQKWLQCKPKHMGSPYMQTPSWKSPYSAGLLADSLVRDGVNMTNFIRFVAGLPDDVVADKELMKQAQHGALLMAVLGTITHSPTKPADMPADLYKIGAASAASSNLGMGYATVAESIHSYMDDSDAGNISRLGHRRWILNPQMRQIAFGYVKKSGYETYTTTQVFDRSRRENVQYDFTAWPTRDVFPVEFFDVKQAWSVTLNPEQYQVPDKRTVNVRLQDQTTGKQWGLNAASSGTGGAYFNVDTAGFGVPNCIIFRPGGVRRYGDGDHYTVEISGIKDISGNPTTMKYDVTFFLLQREKML